MYKQAVPSAILVGLLLCVILSALVVKDTKQLVDAEQKQRWLAHDVVGSWLCGDRAFVTVFLLQVRGEPIPVEPDCQLQLSLWAKQQCFYF